MTPPFLGPLRVPGGGAILDWLCRVFGTTREEARRRGEQSSRTVFAMSEVTPKPMKALVGSIFFVSLSGLEEQLAKDLVDLKASDLDPKG